MDTLANPLTWLFGFVAYIILARLFDCWPFPKQTKPDFGPSSEAGLLWSILASKGCPDCGANHFLSGPVRGSSQIVNCANPKCRSSFNITPLYGKAERFGKCLDPYPGDRTPGGAVDLDSVGPRPYHKSDRPAPGIAINRKSLRSANELRLKGGRPMLTHAGFVYVMTMRPANHFTSWLNWFISFDGTLDTRHIAAEPDPGAELIVPPSVLRSGEGEQDDTAMNPA